MTNIIKAVFSGGTISRTEQAYQYDYGQILQFVGIELPQAYEVHFANSDRGESVTQIGNADGVAIPDSMFLSGSFIFAWVFLHTGEDDGETEYRVTIPIIKRAEPSNDTPTPVQQDAITEAIAALNAAVTQTAADAAAAAASAQEIEDMTVSAETLPTGAEASVEKSIVDDVVHLSFGLPRGEQGVQGPTGATPNLTIGTVQTLQPTQNATATITGTPENPVLNLGIPKGNTGEVSEAELEHALIDKADVIISSASGSVASFPDGADGLPMKSVVANIMPVQDLHGYTEPWGPGGGVNLFPDTLPADKLNATIGTDNGQIVIKAANNARVFGIPCEQNTDYAFQHTTGTGGIIVAFSTKAPEIGDVVNNRRVLTNLEFWTTNSGSNTHIIVAATTEADFATLVSDGEMMVFKGSSALADYYPYSNICPITGLNGLSVYVSPTQDVADTTTYAEDWTSQAGTVYAGTVDVVSGVLKKRPYIASYNGETLVGPWISSAEGYAVGRTPTTGAQVVDLGGTETSYQLTAQEVDSLLGQNYVWSTSGNMGVSYRADTKLYIDNKITQAIAAALNA